MATKVEGHYVCICGKEFNNNQAFNGHKSHCKVHQLNKYGSLDNLNARNEKQIKTVHEANTKHYQERIQKENNTWISELHTCERCGKIMTEKYGSGRFCCRACANARDHSEETKQKISSSVKNKKPYFNVDGEVKYFADDAVPEGWTYGNLALVKLKEDWISGNIIYSKNIKHQSYIDTKIKFLQIKNKKQEYLEQIRLNNDKVMHDYLSLLSEKINGRTYRVPDNCYTYGKYLAVKIKDHPRAEQYKMDRVHVHVLMAEELLGRYLSNEEVVHHINEDKYDNRFDNIIIFDTKSSHARFHNSKDFVLSIDNDRLVCSKIIYPKFEYDTENCVDKD